MSKILILNGPNLNLQGKREPEIYGRETIEGYLQNEAETLIFQQSNIEGELINFLHAADENPEISGVVFNAGGYSHTSIALADAVKAISKPVILVHISNIYAREIERRTDLLSAYAAGQIVGLGLMGYKLAIRAIFSGFGERETGFGDRVSGDGDRETGFGDRVSGDGDRVSGDGERESGIGGQETGADSHQTSDLGPRTTD
jgi:3-dehydroquinate dehydratase-2